MQRKYASPEVSIFRVVMETAVAGGQVVSIQADNWVGDDVIGDEPGEGGDIYIAW